MSKHDEPERDLEGCFRGLMTELALRQKGAWPPADELCEVQRGFRDTPLTGFRAALIASIRKEGEYR